MCGGLRIHRVTIRPGMPIKYRTLAGPKTGIWGVANGAYNARSENLATTWAQLRERRGVIEVDTFNEKGVEFKALGGTLHLPVLYDFSDDIVLITCNSVGEVKQVHHRMPIPLTSEQETVWLQEGSLPTLPGDIIIREPVPKIDRRREWLMSLARK